jgi:hypothetical protein
MRYSIRRNGKPQPQDNAPDLFEGPREGSLEREIIDYLYDAVDYYDTRAIACHIRWMGLTSIVTVYHREMRDICNLYPLSR